MENRLRGTLCDDCWGLELVGPDDADKLELALFVTGFPARVVLITSGGRTDVDVGVMIVVIYARITKTVGALVTVTEYPL